MGLADGQCFGGVETYEKTSGTTVLCDSGCTSQGLLSQPLSVYFTAVREEAYVGGGEEYLTFSSCPVNSGQAMDFKSGIFSVPVTGK